MKKQSSKKMFACCMLLLAAGIWGFSYSVQRNAAEVMGPFTVTCIKASGGFLLLPLIMAKKLRFSKFSVIAGILSGLVLVVGNSFQQMGLERSTPGKAGFLVSLYILFVPILGLLRKQVPTLKIWICVMVATVGIYFLNAGDGLSVDGGTLLLLIAALMMALQIHIVDKYIGQTEGLTMACVELLTNCLCSGLLMIFVEKPSASDFYAIRYEILYMVILSGAVAESLQIVYQRDVEPILASLLLSFESVFSVLGGWLLLGVTLSPRELFGCCLIFAAIVAAQIQSSSSSSS